MGNLENVSAEDLRQILAEVGDADALDSIEPPNLFTYLCP